MKLTIRRDHLVALLEGQGREEPRHQLVRVRRERDVVACIVEQTREPGAHLVRLLERLLPHIIDILGRIEPRLLLRLERHVGPRLMRMTRKENALADSEARVVFGEFFRIYQCLCRPPPPSAAASSAAASSAAASSAAASSAAAS